MIVEINGLEINLDELMDAFVQLLKGMGLDETDDQQVYQTITVLMASLIASGIQAEYGNDPVKKEERMHVTCKTIAEDLEKKIKAFLQI